MKHITVLMLSWEFPPRIIGGIAAHVHDLALALGQSNIDVKVITCDFPGAKDYEEIDSHLFVRNGDEIIPDPLADDLALVINADFGLVIILGCVHRGMVNTLRHARTMTGQKTIYAVIGGTHLIGASEERIERTIADLREMGIQWLGVSHCTGFPASAQLARAFGDTFFLNNAGTRFVLP